MAFRKQQKPAISMPVHQEIRGKDMATCSIQEVVLVATLVDACAAIDEVRNLTVIVADTTRPPYSGRTL